jgi:hypothetical protein
VSQGGGLAEIMVKTAPEIYRKYIYVGANTKPVLYVKLQKALYGCLRSELLFYLKLLKDLEDRGFKMNPYDPCVANKIINGKKITITWHVNDLKLSHADVKGGRQNHRVVKEDLRRRHACLPRNEARLPRHGPGLFCPGGGENNNGGLTEESNHRVPGSDHGRGSEPGRGPIIHSQSRGGL